MAPPEMADNNSDWEENPRINNSWNLLDIPPASISICAAEPPLGEETAATFPKTLQEKSSFRGELKEAASALWT